LVLTQTEGHYKALFETWSVGHHTDSAKSYFMAGYLSVLSALSFHQNERQKPDQRDEVTRALRTFMVSTASTLAVLVALFLLGAFLPMIFNTVV
jgi:hypothetical protein